MTTQFSQSDNMKREYCCSVVQIGSVTPIEGSDFLGVVQINGLPMVVRKDQITEGQVLFYASNECQLNSNFCKVNNLYSDPELNEDHSRKGYFNKYGRVRMVKLRGQVSMGYLFDMNEMNTWSKVTTMPVVGTEFDTVNGELFIKAFVPPMKQSRGPRIRKTRRSKTFDRLVPGEFFFHYDTDQLGSNINQFHPNDNISISVKLHGTSLILGNIRTLEPKYQNGVLGRLYTKYFNQLPKFLQFTREKYDYICSSRSVIVNNDINPHDIDSGYAGGAVQREIMRYCEAFKNLGVLDEGTTIYGEIVGYYNGTSTGIQKVGNVFDYGCPEGTNKLMIYRITTHTDDGIFEWNVQEVHDWTVRIMKEYPILSEMLHPIDILYNGDLCELYSDIAVDDNWRDNVLQRMKTDKRWHMEENEPLCHNKVPREGIVIRKNNDPVKEAFKLKCVRFLSKEAENIDKGVVDVEMEETYEEK